MINLASASSLTPRRAERNLFAFRERHLFVRQESSYDWTCDSAREISIFDERTNVLCARRADRLIPFRPFGSAISRLLANQGFYTGCCSLEISSNSPIRSWLDFTTSLPVFFRGNNDCRRSRNQARVHSPVIMVVYGQTRTPAKRIRSTLDTSPNVAPFSMKLIRKRQVSLGFSKCQKFQTEWLNFLVLCLPIGEKRAELVKLNRHDYSLIAVANWERWKILFFVV